MFSNMARLDAIKAVKPTEERQNNRKCLKCGRFHKFLQACPVHGKQCFKCKKWDHFSNMCLTRNMHQVEQVGDEYKKNDEGELQFSIISVNKCNVADELFVNLYLHPFHFFVRSKLDSGAEVNILPKNILDKYDPKAHLNPTC